MAGRPPTGRVMRLAGPVKLLTQRFAFVLLLALAAALLGIGRADPEMMERGRAYIVDVSTPVLTVLARPVDATREAVAEAEAMLTLYSTNLELREENRRLRDWQTAARRLEQENQALRSLLALQPEPRTTVVAARVIAEGGGPFVRTLVIDVGADAGVEKGHIVVDASGVIGRITASGAQASRVLLLTDLNSRVPVRVEGTRQRAVLAGDNTDRPRLAFLPATAKLHPGDRLVTSGDGGLFPAGLPVGVVETVGPDGVRVRPWSDLESMEFIRVVRYDARSLALDGIENEGPGTVRRLAPKAPVTAAQAADAEAAAAARAQPPAAPAAQTAPSAEAPAAADPDPASDRPE